jgi:hypothetical protein
MRQQVLDRGLILGVLDQHATGELAGRDASHAADATEVGDRARGDAGIAIDAGDGDPGAAAEAADLAHHVAGNAAQLLRDRRHRAGGAASRRLIRCGTLVAEHLQDRVAVGCGRVKLNENVVRARVRSGAVHSVERTHALLDRAPLLAGHGRHVHADAAGQGVDDARRAGRLGFGDARAHAAAGGSPCGSS